MAKLNRFALLLSLLVALQLFSTNFFVGVNAQETEEVQPQAAVVQEVDTNTEVKVDEATSEPKVVQASLNITPEQTLQQPVQQTTVTTTVVVQKLDENGEPIEENLQEPVQDSAIAAQVTTTASTDASDDGSVEVNPDQEKMPADGTEEAVDG